MIKKWQERAGTFKETYLGHSAMQHFHKEVQAEIDELRAENTALEVRIGALLCERSDLVQKVMDERDALRAELDRLKQQEPVTYTTTNGGVETIPLYLAAGAQPVMKDHEIAALVNRLTAIAKEFGQTQQLRERIAYEIRPVAVVAQPAEIEALRADAERFMHLALALSDMDALEAFEKSFHGADLPNCTTVDDVRGRIDAARAAPL